MTQSPIFESGTQGSSRDYRDTARIFAPLAFGILLALGASTLWALYSGSLLRDAEQARTRQIHAYTGLYELMVSGAENPDPLPGTRFDYSRFAMAIAGLDFNSVVSIVESDASAAGEPHSTFITRYSRPQDGQRRAYTYRDSMWETTINTWQFLRFGTIIIILSVVTLSLGPITVLLVSMLRRRGGIKRFQSDEGDQPGENLYSQAMKAVSGSSGLPLLLIDQRGGLAAVSPGAEALLELHKGGDIGDLSSLISIPEAFRRRCLDSESSFRERIDLAKAGGSSQSVEAIFQHVAGGAGSLGGVLILIPEGHLAKGDERVATESESRQEQEVLNGMVKGLAHDLNNRVAGIVGAASLGIRESTVDWELAGRFRDILREAGKLSDVCSELQLLLLNAGSESGICDPSHEMARISQVLRSVMPFNIAVEAGGVSRYKLMVDRGLLRQFFFSLAMASSDQMKGGTGRIRINLSDRLPRQILAPDVERGNRICFRYSDGFIMPPDLRDVFSAREYEPSDVDRQFGTSYGTAYRACLEFGGWISFERGMGETILCLVMKGIASQGSNEAAQEFSSQYEEGMRVLLADDVDLVRETLGEFLRSQDFEVVTVSNGDEAMEELSRTSFDVIVLDLNMPGTPSISIATHCVQAFPRMAVILSSGYEKPEGIQELLSHERVVFLPKPSPPGEMVRLLKKMVRMDGRGRDDYGE